MESTQSVLTRKGFVNLDRTMSVGRVLLPSRKVFLGGDERKKFLPLKEWALTPRMYGAFHIFEREPRVVGLHWEMETGVWSSVKAFAPGGLSNVGESLRHHETYVLVPKSMHVFMDELKARYATKVDWKGHAPAAAGGELHWLLGHPDMLAAVERLREKLEFRQRLASLKVQQLRLQYWGQTLCNDSKAA